MKKLFYMWVILASVLLSSTGVVSTLQFDDHSAMLEQVQDEDGETSFPSQYSIVMYKAVMPIVNAIPQAVLLAELVVPEPENTQIDSKYLLAQKPVPYFNILFRYIISPNAP
ncbi:MAG: hypothetical protein JJU28_06750 [Cyclobacteriaceae bacterium]|nr:hypothetical protein [Cyclobacteriaceae bacterium]